MVFYLDARQLRFDFLLWLFFFFPSLLIIDRVEKKNDVFHIYIMFQDLS